MAILRKKTITIDEVLERVEPGSEPDSAVIEGETGVVRPPEGVSVVAPVDQA